MAAPYLIYYENDLMGRRRSPLSEDLISDICRRFHARFAGTFGFPVTVYSFLRCEDDARVPAYGSGEKARHME
ncbi:MAG: hypothetical protein HY517_02815 [Candidatus Aenigmarchaeota archaeon]|nr:hypothetical protein [Candidatus Aenigmarchaeota archaeon]